MIKKQGMKTLKELIDDGLPVGALLKDRFNIYQFHSHNGMCTLYNLSSKSWATVFYEFTAKPTTAYDSQIDPETLPIEEPFWTGWFVLDRIKREITKIEPCGDGFDLYFYDNSIVYSSICQPCLPPA